MSLDISDVGVKGQVNPDGASGMTLQRDDITAIERVETGVAAARCPYIPFDVEWHLDIDSDRLISRESGRRTTNRRARHTA